MSYKNKQIPGKKNYFNIQGDLFIWVSKNYSWSIYILSTPIVFNIFLDDIIIIKNNKFKGSLFNVTPY